MLALQNSFRDRSINADIFGNAMDELLFTPAGTKEKPMDPENAKDLQGFTAIHPINIDLQRKMDEKIEFKGNVPKGWVFKRDPEGDYSGGIKLPLGRVAHLIYNKIGDEILGMSSIEPVFKTAERHLKVEEGIAHGVLTYGNPTRDFIVGDETHPPTKKMLDGGAKREDLYAPTVEHDDVEAFEHVVHKVPGEPWDGKKHLEAEKPESPVDLVPETPLEGLAGQEITDDPVRLYLYEIGRKYLPQQIL